MTTLRVVLEARVEVEVLETIEEEESSVDEETWVEDSTTLLVLLTELETAELAVETAEEVALAEMAVENPLLAPEETPDPLESPEALETTDDEVAEVVAAALMVPPRARVAWVWQLELAPAA